MVSSPVILDLNDPINLLDIFIISGILSCLVIGIKILLLPDNKLSKYLLSLILFVFCLHQIWIMMYDLNLNAKLSFLFRLPFIYLFALGPLIYFYIRSLTDIKFRLVKKDFIHFIPLFFEIVGHIYFNNWIVKDQESYHITSFQVFSTTEITLCIISIMIYINKGIRLINKHDEWILHNYSYTKGIILEWLKKLSKYYRFFWILMFPYVIVWALIFNEIPIFKDDYWFYFIVHILILVLNYSTFFFGLENYIRISDLGGFVVEERKPIDKSNGRIEKVSDEQINELKKKLNDAINEDKIYLNPKLSLHDLSKHLNIPYKMVSSFLNKELNQSFHDYINSHRVIEVQNKIKDPSYNHYTLFGLALESGFSSKATFNRIFKFYSGMTPKQYAQKFGNS